jgi:hypothetical protein
MKFLFSMDFIFGGGGVILVFGFEETLYPPKKKKKKKKPSKLCRLTQELTPVIIVLMMICVFPFVL